MKTKIHFNQKSYDSFANTLESFRELLTEAQSELTIQGVKGYSLEQLKNGNFVEAFNNYHITQQKKNELTAGIIYGKYLELYGFTVTKLESLEASYKGVLNRSIEFYPLNNSFYQYCKVHQGNNQKLKTLLDKAPTIKSYSKFDFISIKGDTVKIDVPKELFTLYAVNKTQTAAIDNVYRFISVAKKLNLDNEYMAISELLNKYLYSNSVSFGLGNEIGLSSNLESIGFQWNKILIL